MSQHQPSSPPSEHQRAYQAARRMSVTLSNVRRLLELDAQPETVTLNVLETWAGTLVDNAHEVRQRILAMRREQRLREMGQR